MSSSNIQIIFTLIKLSLAFLGINVFVDFKDLNIFSKVYRILTLINIVFFYFIAFMYTFIYNIRYPNENRMEEQFLLFNCILGSITIAARIYLSFRFKDKYFSVFNWILNIHEQHPNRTLQNYIGTKYEMVGVQFVKIWRWVNQEMVFLRSNSN